MSATNSATPSLQSVLSGAGITQARREADRAQARAHKLRQEADQAEDESRQSQGRLSSLSQNSAQADPTYEPRRPNPTQSMGRFVNLRV